MLKQDMAKVPSRLGNMRCIVPERRNRVKKEPGDKGACGFKELKKSTTWL